MATATNTDQDTIELEDYASFKSRLYHIHQKQMINHSNKGNTLQLVEILGGIDQMLYNYLSQSHNNPMMLTETQLKAIENATCNTFKIVK